jgi:hypothetical protein
VDARRTLNGAIAGGIAAAVWAAQQAADKRAFKVDYDDVELLGKAVVKGEGWLAPGLALHVQNGAAFGALYTQLRPFLPGPPAVKGLTLATAEHLATWPALALVERFHPRAGEITKIRGNRNAFLQAAWRHALFGAILGEIEGRLNADSPDEPPEVPVSSNGHGHIELAVGAA